ncbi:MAG: DNA-formamidopyrimidine glycosylase family protein [Flavobacteriaceae bacterium]|nr:DNA-formamidopyrimidine glycosylase family protein [Flavobacteriaceae bacterium]
MPELPEVYGYQTYIESTILHKPIIDMDCRDNRLLRKPINQFEKYLVGKEFTGTKRIGKYLFLKTNGEKTLLIHFGMTGKPKYYKHKDERPKYAHIVLTLGNGFHFAFENRRKLGRWDLVDSIEEYRKENNLSKDAKELTFKEFKSSLENRKTDIKKILMDQSIAAGVGNWIADDILYQAKIHPKKPVTELSEKEIKTIYEKMQHVLDTAIELDAHYKSFPDYFFKNSRKEGADCPCGKGKVEKIKVGGRTTYFCPEEQQV